MAYRISFTRNTKVSTKKVLDFEIQDAVRSLKRGESARLESVELSKIIEIMRWYTKGCYIFKIDDIECCYDRGRLLAKSFSYQWSDAASIIHPQLPNTIYYEKKEDKSNKIWYYLDYYRYGNVSADLVITRKKRFARSLRAPKKLFKHFEL